MLTCPSPYLFESSDIASHWSKLPLCFVNHRRKLVVRVLAQVSTHEGTSRKAIMYMPTCVGMRCPQIYAKYYATFTNLCVGNIIANKYLLPVAGSINIKEKLPKNWKLSLLYNTRGTFVFLLSPLLSYFKRLYRSTLWLELKIVSKLILEQLYLSPSALTTSAPRKFCYNSFNFVNLILKYEYVLLNFLKTGIATSRNLTSRY